jgi:hypothetical protein
MHLHFQTIKKNAWLGKVHQPKQNILGFLLYMGSQAESRYNFGKDQGLARRKGKKKG